MSTQLSRSYQLWDNVEDCLRHYRFFSSGQQLDPGIIVPGYLLLFVCWSECLSFPRGSTSPVDLRWVTNLAKVDVGEVFRLFKMADQLLIESTWTGGTWESFKQTLKTEFPWSGGILAPLRGRVAAWFCDDDELSQRCEAFADCHQALSFASRLHHPGLDEVRDKALDDYLSGEQSLKQDGFTCEEADLLTTWYPRSLLPLFYEHVKCKHGSGSVADAQASLASKYRAIGTDDLIRYLNLRIGSKGDGPRPPGVFHRQAKLVMVPKTFLAYRSISMEPATLMWYQQGILSAFVYDLKHRERHPLRKRFRPDDQSPNRDLAWEGSISGDFATIDLSAASDSVSWELVRRWFRGTCLYPFMVATRSRSVLLPGGETLQLRKYAPMGSALCFPVECTVFAAITECAIRQAGGDPYRSRYRVYGDDIVVETHYADAVMRRLEENGFTVNFRKSFFRRADFLFRESCGGEFLNGTDVAPIRISRRFAGWSDLVRHPARILALVDLANDCVVRLPMVRLCVLRKLNQLPVARRLIFDSTGEGGLFSTQPTNFHLLPPRHNEDWQCREVSHGVLTPTDEPWTVEEEDIRLFEYLRVSQGRERLLYPEDRVDVSVAPKSAGKWSRKWSPVE